MDFDNIHSVGNAIEAGLWFIMATVLLILGVRRLKLRKLFWIASVTLVAFGFSDLVEIETGGWWRPWWLLAWKGTCVLILVMLWWSYRKTLRESANTTN